MEYANLLSRLSEKHHLYSTSLELTYQCNLDCFYCYNDLDIDGQPLTLEQYRRLFRDLRTLGTLFITLSGGEPLAHPDFFKIAAYARELGFVIRIKSNGHALRGPLARRLKREIDPFNIDISLHGASASTHDRQTRVLGSFRRLVENLPELQALGIRLKLNATLTQWNAHEIDEMHQLADRFGIPLHCYTLVTERDDGDKSPQDIELDWRQKRSVLQYVADRKRATIPINTDNGDVTAEPEKRPNCGAGLTSVLIDPVGNVLPCVEWRRPVGNLHHDSIVDIWSRSTGLQAVRRKNYEVGAMVDAFGDAGRQMGFCPGQAEKQTGSNTRLYPDSRLKLVFHEDRFGEDRQKQRKSA